MLNKNYIQKLASSRSKKAEPKLPQSQIDYSKNRMIVLAKIDSRIEIKNHPHPLTYCRIKINENKICKNWICKNVIKIMI